MFIWNTHQFVYQFCKQQQQIDIIEFSECKIRVQHTGLPTITFGSEQ